MTTPTTVQVELFDSLVKHDYQASQSSLENAVRRRTDVEGKNVKFRKMSKGAATVRGAPSSDVVPMNVTHSIVTCTLSDWDASEYTDMFRDAKVNFDEVAELSTTIVSALNRRKDQLIIDVLDAATMETGHMVTVSIGAADSNINLTKILRAQSILDKKEVPTEERFFVAHTNQKQAILAIAQATSGDYVNSKPLESGKFPYFLGFNWIWIGDRSEGGLDIDGSDVRNCYAFDRRALGLAMGTLGGESGQMTEVNYVPQKKSWLSSGSLSAGATVIDGNGIVKVLCDET